MGVILVNNITKKNMLGVIQSKTLVLGVDVTLAWGVFLREAFQKIWTLVLDQHFETPQIPVQILIRF